MNKVRYAIIGVGYLGRFHAQKIAALEGAQLVAVCDIDLEQAKTVAALYNVPTFTDYRQLLGKVDAVSIVVPTTLHYEVAKFFLQNSIHALVEKPITTTVKEAEELIELAEKHNVVLQVGHLERFNPILLALRDRVKNPLFIESVRLSPYKLRGSDVNVVLDLMIHDIDIIQYLVGVAIQDIHASGAPVLSDKIDIANARLEFVNGCVANVTASRISIKSERYLRIFQQNAYFSGDLQNKSLHIHSKGSKEMFPGIPEINRETLSLSNSDALADEINAFLDAVRNGKAPLVSGVDGLRALQTAMRITKIVMENIEKYREQ